MSTLTEMSGETLIYIKNSVYVTQISLCLEGNVSVFRLICEKNINFIGGNFPCVNVDIRGVALLMSTHVNWREVGGREEPNFGQRKL